MTPENVPSGGMCAAADRSSCLSSLIAEPVAPLSPLLPQRRTSAKVAPCQLDIGAGLGERGPGDLVVGAAPGISPDNHPSGHHHLLDFQEPPAWPPPCQAASA